MTLRHTKRLIGSLAALVFRGGPARGAAIGVLCGAALIGASAALLPREALAGNRCGCEVARGNHWNLSSVPAGIDVSYEGEASGCAIYIDGNLAGGMAEHDEWGCREWQPDCDLPLYFSYRFPDSYAASVHGVEIRCTDKLGHVSFDDARTITVAPAVAPNQGASADGRAPTVGYVNVLTPNPTVGSTVRFAVHASDDYAISSCSLVVDGSSVASVEEGNNGLYEFAYVPAAPGAHFAVVSCADAKHNVGKAPERARFSVNAALGTASSASVQATDSSCMTVGTIFSDSGGVEAGRAVKFYLNANYATVRCMLVVDGVEEGEMRRDSSGIYAKEHVFPSAAVGRFVAGRCYDAFGNVKSSPEPKAFAVANGKYVLSEVAKEAASISEDIGLVGSSSAGGGCRPDTLIKTSGDRAVYYCGLDGKRYTFPNSAVFATWYTDFSSVTEVTLEQMASYRLAGNVTYRPGARLVKVVSSPAVYAVAKGGVLRPIESEAVASALYGSDWNKKIDDMPDVFFVNYKVGPSVTAGDL